MGRKLSMILGLSVVLLDIQIDLRKAIQQRIDLFSVRV